MRSLASYGILISSSSASGHNISPFITFSNRSSGVFPLNGGILVRNSYKIIPIDHQSTALPYLWRKITSGAKYFREILINQFKRKLNLI